MLALVHIHDKYEGEHLRSLPQTNIKLVYYITHHSGPQHADKRCFISPNKKREQQGFEGGLSLFTKATSNVRERIT